MSKFNVNALVLNTEEQFDINDFINNVEYKDLKNKRFINEVVVDDNIKYSVEYLLEIKKKTIDKFKEKGLSLNRIEGETYFDAKTKEIVFNFTIKGS